MTRDNPRNQEKKKKELRTEKRNSFKSCSSKTDFCSSIMTIISMYVGAKHADADD